MNYEKIVRIPVERIAVLIGKGGKIKSYIEETCAVKINIDGQTGEVSIYANSNIENMLPFKAEEIILAIGRGFSPDNAFDLLKEQNTLHVMDIREFSGKSPKQVERVRARLIGENGRARKSIESLSGTKLSIYGRTVSIIGDVSKMKNASDAISALCLGSMHGSVYGRLESSRRRIKQEKMILWEGQDVHS